VSGFFFGGGRCVAGGCPGAAFFSEAPAAAGPKLKVQLCIPSGGILFPAPRRTAALGKLRQLLAGVSSALSLRERASVRARTRPRRTATQTAGPRTYLLGGKRLEELSEGSAGVEGFAVGAVDLEPRRPHALAVVGGRARRGRRVRRAAGHEGPRPEGVRVAVPLGRADAHGRVKRRRNVRRHRRRLLRLLRGDAAHGGQGVARSAPCESAPALDRPLAVHCSHASGRGLCLSRVHR
jgi:hypothetical protein